MNSQEEIFFQEIAERVKPEFRSLAESISEHYDITGQLSYKQASWLARTAEYQGVIIPPTVADKISRYNFSSSSNQASTAIRKDKSQATQSKDTLSDIALRLVELTEAVKRLVEMLANQSTTA